jgi:glutathione synthase/RimK-type ligase-like ATP-grasp enzyme
MNPAVVEPDWEPAQSPDLGTPPHTLIGLAHLMRQAFGGIDLAPQAQALIAFADCHPEDAAALLDLSTMLLLTGHRSLALSTQREALQMRQHYRLPAPDAPTLRVLVMLAPGDLMANTPVEFLLEHSSMAHDLMYVGFEVPAMESVPEHDVLFVAIGESDDNAALLAALAPILDDWPRPVVNRPAQIATLSRTGASVALQGLPGVCMPASLRVGRAAVAAVAMGEADLATLADGVPYPLIMRPVGSHAGQDLDRIDSHAMLAAYLARVQADEFYVSRYVDYRSADGQFRKYRIMLVDGHPYLAHMAISSHWMIHYLNAGMTESAVKRAEEAACMASFQEDFALRHAPAFAAIGARLGLSYVGVDCAETTDGALLIFEADSDMIVHAMDPTDLFSYKQEPMQQLFAGFQSMLARAALAD